jgi:hypothetical protein
MGDKHIPYNPMIQGDRQHLEAQYVFSFGGGDGGLDF